MQPTELTQSPSAKFLFVVKLTPERRSPNPNAVIGLPVHQLICIASNQRLESV